MINPYTIGFGKKPKQNIIRTTQLNMILENFEDPDLSQQIFVITGVRGSGKTVFMTEVAQSLQKNDEWIVISLNPEKDLLESLMSKLYNRKDLGSIFKEAKINLSFFGIGVDIARSRQITDVEVAITRMLENLKKHKKRLLVTIDEVTGTQNMRVFASSFQIMIRDELPIFLLMTGLYDNISKLENQDSMTFLYRAPKVELAPLNIGVMTDNYQNVLNLDREKALDLAKKTKGYSFAFQVLGHFVWKYEGDVERAMPEFKQYLDDYVYDKIWMGLSREDKRVLYGMASVQDDRVKTIRDYLNMETNSFNPYRKRLIRKGLVDGSEYGTLRFALPLFEQYVLENY